MIKIDQLSEDKDIISSQLIRYWLANRRMVAFQPLESSREVVDLWVACVQETAQNWAKDQPFLSLQDLRLVSVNPYSRQKADELAQSIADKRGYSAILMMNNYLGQAMGFFVNTFINRGKQELIRQVFTSKEEALAWLESHLPPEG